MAVHAKPKSYRGTLTSSLSTVHTAPTAVPSDWGAGYAAGQMKHLTIANGSDIIDVDVSAVLAGTESISQAGERLLAEMLNVASGKLTRCEVLGNEEIAITRILRSI